MVRLFVGGLTEDIRPEMLEDRFKPFGAVSSCELVPLKFHDGVSDPDPSRCRGFAYVEFEPKDEASYKRCLSLYNGCKWRGCVLRVEAASPNYQQRFLLDVQKEEQAAAEAAAKAEAAAAAAAAEAQEANGSDTAAPPLVHRNGEDPWAVLVERARGLRKAMSTVDEDCIFAFKAPSGDDSAGSDLEDALPPPEELWDGWGPVPGSRARARLISGQAAASQAMAAPTKAAAKPAGTLAKKPVAGPGPEGLRDRRDAPHPSTTAPAAPKPSVSVKPQPSATVHGAERPAAAAAAPLSVAPAAQQSGAGGAEGAEEEDEGPWTVTLAPLMPGSNPWAAFGGGFGGFGGGAAAGSGFGFGGAGVAPPAPPAAAAAAADVAAADVAVAAAKPGGKAAAAAASKEPMTAQEAKGKEGKAGAAVSAATPAVEPSQKAQEEGKEARKAKPAARREPSPEPGSEDDEGPIGSDGEPVFEDNVPADYVGVTMDDDPVYGARQKVRQGGAESDSEDSFDYERQGRGAAVSGRGGAASDDEDDEVAAATAAPPEEMDVDLLARLAKTAALAGLGSSHARANPSWPGGGDSGAEDGTEGAEGGPKSKKERLADWRMKRLQRKEEARKKKKEDAARAAVAAAKKEIAKARLREQLPTIDFGDAGDTLYAAARKRAADQGGKLEKFNSDSEGEAHDADGEGGAGGKAGRRHKRHKGAAPPPKGAELSKSVSMFLRKMGRGDEEEGMKWAWTTWNPAESAGPGGGPPIAGGADGGAAAGGAKGGRFGAVGRGPGFERPAGFGGGGRGGGRGFGGGRGSSGPGWSRPPRSGGGGGGPGGGGGGGRGKQGYTME